MGSAVSRVGNFGGIVVATFTAAGQDTGPITSVTTGIPYGWEKYGFMLIGSGTGYAITAYGTWDAATRNGTSTGNAGVGYWFKLPGVITEAGTPAWSNPMLTDTNQNNNALYVKADPIAIRFTSAAYLGATPTGTIQVIAFVTP